MKPSYYKN